MNLAMGRSNSKKPALVGAIIGFVSRHAIAISKLPVDFDVKVRKSLPHVGIEFEHAGLVRGCSRLRRVIDNILCEEFVEYFEFALALNFLRISAHNRLRCLRNCHGVHKRSFLITEVGTLPTVSPRRRKAVSQTSLNSGKLPIRPPDEKADQSRVADGNSPTCFINVPASQ